MAGMKVGDFQLFLGSRGIPMHYDKAAYHEDLQAIRDLGLE